MRHGPFVAVVSTSLLAVALAAADPADGSAQADALFRAGRAAADAGDHRKACEHFAESNRLEPAAGTWLNLGICSQHLGELEAARDYFGRVLEALPASDPRYGIAQQKMREVEEALAKQAPPPAELDRAPAVQAEPEPALAAAPVKQTPAPAPAQAPREAEPGSAAQKTWGYVLGGSGLVLLGVSGGTAFLVHDRKTTVEKECPNQICVTDAGYDAAEQGKTYSLISSVTFFAGAASLGAGAYLLLTAADTSKAESRKLRVTPLVSQRGAALDVAVRF